MTTKYPNPRRLGLAQRAREHAKKTTRPASSTPQRTKDKRFASRFQPGYTALRLIGSTVLQRKNPGAKPIAANRDDHPLNGTALPSMTREHTNPITNDAT